MKPLIIGLGLSLGAVLGIAEVRAQLPFQPRAEAQLGAATCRVESQGDVPFSDLRGRPVATLMVNDRSEAMLLATGEDRTSLTKTLIDQLQLPEATKHAEAGFKSKVERPSRHQAYTVRSLRFGPASWMAHTVETLETTPGFQQDPSNLQGEIGWDILSEYDIDLDFSRHVATLYRVSGCQGRFLPWKGPYEAFKTLAADQHDFTIPITLNGHTLSAQIATEVRDTIVSVGSAHALGITQAELSHDPTAPVTEGSLAKATPRHQFATLQVGEESFAAPRLIVADVGRKPTEVKLGMEFLRGRRLWLSYSTGQVFIQAAGPRAPDPNGLARLDQGAATR